MSRLNQENLAAKKAAAEAAAASIANDLVEVKEEGDDVVPMNVDDFVRSTTTQQQPKSKKSNKAGKVKITFE